jgi:phosphoribosylanthranilate isomerase
MSRVRIKICCISSIDEAQLAIAAGADALGLVSEMPSGPGVIDDELIREIALTVPPPVASVLLTSRRMARDIADHAKFAAVNTVQIVDHVDPAQHDTMARIMPGVRRMQVIHVEDGGALDLLNDYGLRVNAFLLDSGRPKAETRELGGTGRIHDWAVSAEFVRRSPVPVFLAGGLHPGNVADAIAQVRPYGVDLCSGVRSGGRLDPAKLASFMAQTKLTFA